jgi:WD40 repeat protein
MVLKAMEGHRNKVEVLVVSRDGQIIASGDENGEIIAWHGETGEPLTQPIKAHSDRITSLDFSPDGMVLATGSWDTTTKFWCTETWQTQGNPIQCHATIHCVRYSPQATSNFRRGQPQETPQVQLEVAIATSAHIEIYDSYTRQRVTYFEAHSSSLAWVSDKRLLSGGDHVIAIHPTGTLVASVSDNNHVRLWRLEDRQIIAIFQHASIPTCVTFSVDGKHILCGGQDKISEWAVPNCIHPKILAISTARDACIIGDLSTAEKLTTKDIHTDADDYTSYANRSLVMARKHAWDHALEDAIKSISIQPSLTGYISKGIALCVKGRVRDARAAFDVASLFTNQDSATNHFILLIKAIALFNADRHQEAMLLVKELAAACPNADALGCRVVEAYFCIQLGTKALGDAHYDEAVDHFTTTVNSGAFSSQNTHLIYEDLTALFGWDLRPVRFNAYNVKSLLVTTHQKRSRAFLSAGKLDEALEAYQIMKDAIGNNITANYLEWSNAFKQECSALCAVNGDAALTASDYDRAIVLYSAAINLDFASHAIFANRCKAKLGKMLWMEALLDAQQVIELDSLSYLGYNLKHAALHGARRYDEAIQTFQTMFSKFDDAPDVQTRELCQKHLRPSEVESAIRRVIDVQLENAPLRVLDTTTGLLCVREAQISALKMSMEYKELVSSTIMQKDLPMERIEEVAMSYFQYATLSHRWEGKEPLLQDIQGNGVYDLELDPVGGMTKLRSFCKTARDAGYKWAWSDTCCIDKSNNVELQESVNSMFVWYHHSALTIVYLSDVPPLSKSGALAKSVWNTRGWTIQEFLASKVILFYQNNWTLYLDDRTPNHKESVVIMQELQGATGIDRLTVTAFRPSMNSAREKLHWASTRVTTHQEDIAYSLFGIFGVRLPVNYGEKQDRALGRLLREIVARSGDITGLDWVGTSSEFNSCLPASITSYETPPCRLPLLSEDEFRSSVSSLRKTVAMDLALKLYTLLRNMTAPRFAAQRLHLPCIAFNVREVRRVRSPAPETLFTYGVKADGLRDLLITTEETLVQFWPVRPTKQKFVLIRPWDQSFLELPDHVQLSEFVEPSGFEHHTESEEDYCMPPSSPSDDWSSCSPARLEVVDIESRALRLLVRLQQPFSAFLLAQQRSGEYKRIAADHDIIGQVNDVVSVGDLMDIRTIEIS